MDTYLENEQEKSISDIFKEYGEEYFRDLEFNACLKLSSLTNTVICLGGGALTFKRNADALRKPSLVVFMDVSPETVEIRLAGDNTRPLLQKKNKHAEISALMEKRYPLYKEFSDVTIDANADAETVAANILKLF